MSKRLRLEIELDASSAVFLRRLARSERRTPEDQAAVLVERLLWAWEYGGKGYDEWGRLLHAVGLAQASSAPEPIEDEPVEEAS